MKNKNTKRNILIALAVVGIVAVFGIGRSIASILTSGEINYEPEESFAVLTISGTIQDTPSSVLDTLSYNHSNLMDYVDYLIEDEGNKGIFLKVNSGGGAVYQSDEFYLKLMEYKEKTGRPVHAYFEDTAASGAYYISCAADYISANRNSWTGSIGVIISYYNYSQLLDKLGVEEVIISTGPNKGMGSSASQLTENQREIYQSLVDDCYERFVSIVAQSRHLDIETVKQLADGRVYTAAQALDNGLIDNICSYDEAIDEMTAVTGGYEPYYVYFDSKATFIDYLFAKVNEVTPKNEFETLNKLFSQDINGKPLYYFAG